VLPVTLHRFSAVDLIVCIAAHVANLPDPHKATFRG
jgi:hypothetical protein